MCCNLQIHVIVISVISLCVSGFASLEIIASITAYINSRVTEDAKLIYGGSMGLALGIQVLLYAIWLVSETLCLIGAIKKKKILLIPFIIVQFLQILICIGFIIRCVILGSQHIPFIDSNATRPGGISLYFLILPLLIALGLTIYFVTIAMQFYEELSSRIVGGQTMGNVLPPYTSHMPVQASGGISTVYVTPGTENVIYSYRQQPPSYEQTQQAYGYSKYNPGMKNPV